MYGFLKTNLVAVVACCTLALGAGCADGDVVSVDAGIGGNGGIGGNATNGGNPAVGPDASADDSGPMTVNLLAAPAATMVGTVELAAPLTDVINVGDLSIGLYEDGGAAILNLSDPTAPQVLSELATAGHVVGVEYDAERALLFVASVSGDFRVYRVADPASPVAALASTLIETGADADSFKGIARIGTRLYLLGQNQVLPVDVLDVVGSTNLSLIQNTPIDIDGDSVSISAGAGSLYITFPNRKVQTWSGGDAPEMAGEATLDGDITGWVVKGSRVFAALRGAGLQVLDFSTPSAPRTLFSAPQFNDLTALKRFGQMVLVALERGNLVALDLSDIEAPRPLVTRQGSLPDWIAPSGGNLVLGSGNNLSVFGVPPFVASSVPTVARRSFPLYGRLPVQLSKPIDPGSANSDTVKLRCGQNDVMGDVSVAFDARSFTFKPRETLPADMDCNLEFDGVQDMLGESLTAAQSSMQFTTLPPEPAEIVNPMSEYEHTADGELTDWEPGAEQYEYFDVQAARGMYSHFYADFDGTRLWILNDWYYNGDDIDPDCYNLFGVWTAGGNQRWEIRAYGDQRIAVSLNGVPVDAESDIVMGGYSRSATPNDPTKHTVYEIAIQTDPGSWGVQLHDPGPSFGCERLETDPTNYAAVTDGEGTTIDPTVAPIAPSQPVARQQSGVGTIGTLTPSLAWTSDDSPGNGTTFVLELFAGQGTDESALIYRRVVYGNDFTLPAGLVKNGATYTWRVVARNDAGVSTGDPVTFTVQAGEQVGVTLISMAPANVAFGGSTQLTINGTGFVAGAVILFNGTVLETSVTSTQLVATLSSQFTQTAGIFDVTVRNGDSNTILSGSFQFTVLEPVDVSATAVLSSLSTYEVTVGGTATITVNGSNFASNAYVFFDNLNLPTTYVSSTQLTAVVDDSLTAEVGTHTIGVRNDPQDSSTWSGTVAFNVVAVVEACTHSECLPGNNLVDGCSTCATAVCDSNPECCSVGWNQACVALAAAIEVCTGTCTPPAMVSIDPVSILPNTNTGVQITVNMTNAPSEEYHMVLSPTQGNEIAVSCAYVGSNILNCAGDQLPLGVYDTRIIVGDYFDSSNLYTTNTLTDALTVEAEQQTTSTCAGQATVQFGATGSGTCASPFVIDASDALGSTWYHTVSAALLNNQSDASMNNAVCTEGTQRDIIFRVDSNPSATSVTFGAGGPEGSNVIVGRFASDSCDSGLGACVNQGGDAACDNVTTTSPTTSVFYVVSELVQSGDAITVSGSSSNAQ